MMRTMRPSKLLISLCLLSLVACDSSDDVHSFGEGEASRDNSDITSEVDEAPDTSLASEVDEAPDTVALSDVSREGQALADADEAGPDGLTSLDSDVQATEDTSDEGSGLLPLPIYNALPVPAPAWFYQVRLNDIVLDDNGESEDLFIDLPENTSSVFVMVKGEESAYLTLKKAITPPPLSESIVKGPGGHVCVPCKNRVASAQHIGSFLLPNDPDVEIKGGEWTFKVRATHRVEDITQGLVFLGYPSTCDVTVMARTEPVPETGVLPIRLHFTGSHGLSAETAPEDERLQSALDTLTAIYASAGVGVDIVGYHDVAGVEEDPSLTDVGSTAGFPNDLSKLFLSGFEDDPGALNVFFVNSIYKDVDYEEVGGVVLGIAGGVPGPAYLGPSYRSGVAIATFELGDDDHLGNVMAHELGHYLGLFHSTEKDAIFHDTLVDTEENDGENLMFWGWSANQMMLSESQSYVLRSHPMVIPDAD